MIEQFHAPPRWSPLAARAPHDPQLATCANPAIVVPHARELYYVNNDRDPRMSDAVLERLITTLEVSALQMIECSISPGWRLALAAVDSTTIYYSRSIVGELTVGSMPAIALAPHTLVIAPARQPVQI